jgi:hypothetical protein
MLYTNSFVCCLLPFQLFKLLISSSIILEVVLYYTISQFCLDHINYVFIWHHVNERTDVCSESPGCA